MDVLNIFSNPKQLNYFLERAFCFLKIEDLGETVTWAQITISSGELEIHRKTSMPPESPLVRLAFFSFVHVKVCNMCLLRIQGEFVAFVEIVHVGKKSTMRRQFVHWPFKRFPCIVINLLCAGEMNIQSDFGLFPHRHFQ